jgi:hypothetical protein
MELLRRKPFAVCAVLYMTCALIAVSAQAATVRPRLFKTDVFQAGGEMGVGVDFKVPKADSTLPAKAILCVIGKCKTEVITKTGLPAADAQATEYTPNVVFKLDELNRRVTVKTTLVIGTQRYTYTSSAKDMRFSCGSVREVASHLAPRC